MRVFGRGRLLALLTLTSILLACFEPPVLLDVQRRRTEQKEPLDLDAFAAIPRRAEPVSADEVRDRGEAATHPLLPRHLRHPAGRGAEHGAV